MGFLDLNGNFRDKDTIASGMNHVTWMPAQRTNQTASSLATNLEYPGMAHGCDMKRQFTWSMAWFVGLPWAVELDMPLRTGTAASV